MFPQLESRQFSSHGEMIPSNFCSWITKYHSASIWLLWDVCSWSSAVTQKEAQTCPYRETVERPHGESQLRSMLEFQPTASLNLQMYRWRYLRGLPCPSQSCMLFPSPQPSHWHLSCSAPDRPPNSVLSELWTHRMHFGIICYTATGARTFIYLE